MDRELVGNLRIEAATAPFELERGAGWDLARLACDCGGRSFRVVGWPRTFLAVGVGSPQTFSRAFREARAALQSTASIEVPFGLPLFATCEACGREALLLDDERVSGRFRPRSDTFRASPTAAVSVAAAPSSSPSPRR